MGKKKAEGVLRPGVLWGHCRCASPHSLGSSCLHPASLAPVCPQGRCFAPKEMAPGCCLPAEHQLRHQQCEGSEGCTRAVLLAPVRGCVEVTGDQELNQLKSSSPSTSQQRPHGACQEPQVLNQGAKSESFTVHGDTPWARALPSSWGAPKTREMPPQPVQPPPSGQSMVLPLLPDADSADAPRKCFLC